MLLKENQVIMSKAAVINRLVMIGDLDSDWECCEQIQVPLSQFDGTVYSPMEVFGLRTLREIHQGIPSRVKIGALVCADGFVASFLYDDAIIGTMAIEKIGTKSKPGSGLSISKKMMEAFEGRPASPGISFVLVTGAILHRIYKAAADNGFALVDFEEKSEPPHYRTRDRYALSDGQYTLYVYI